MTFLKGQPREYFPVLFLQFLCQKPNQSPDPEDSPSSLFSLQDYSLKPDV